MSGRGAASAPQNRDRYGIAVGMAPVQRCITPLRSVLHRARGTILLRALACSHRCSPRNHTARDHPLAALPSNP